MARQGHGAPWLGPVAVAAGALLLAVGIAPTGQAHVPARTAAQQWLDRAIAYHDPNDVWNTRPLRFEVSMGHSRWWTRELNLLIDNAHGLVQAHMVWNDDVIDITRRGQQWRILLNGSSEISKADADHHDLGPEEREYWSNYFLYLFGLPMKWRDRGIHIDPEPQRVRVHEHDVVQLRATYDPEVGTHIWYLFLDPKSARLLGAKFYLTSEARNDGLTMWFEDELVAGGLRVPQKRHWYTNRGGRFVGTDVVHSVQIVAPPR